MKNLFTPVPDGHYELKFIAADEADKSVAAFAIFHGTQTGPGGPVPPTGKKIAADYVYHIVFDDERIKHMTKIWNDSISMQQLGWGWSDLHEPTSLIQRFAPVNEIADAAIFLAKNGAVNGSSLRVEGGIIRAL